MKQKDKILNVKPVSQSFAKQQSIDVISNEYLDELIYSTQYISNFDTFFPARIV